MPQQGTKSSAKQLAPTDPILGPENLLKTDFAQKGLPSRSLVVEVNHGLGKRGTHHQAAAFFHPNMYFFCLTAFSASNTRFFHLMYFFRTVFFSREVFSRFLKNVSADGKLIRRAEHLKRL